MCKGPEVRTSWIHWRNSNKASGEVSKEASSGRCRQRSPGAGSTSLSPSFLCWTSACRTAPPPPPSHRGLSSGAAPPLPLLPCDFSPIQPQPPAPTSPSICDPGRQEPHPFPNYISPASLPAKGRTSDFQTGGSGSLPTAIYLLTPHSPTGPSNVRPWQPPPTLNGISHSLGPGCPFSPPPSDPTSAVIFPRL